MSQRRRYFTNPFPDLNQNPVATDLLDVKQRVLETAHLVLAKGNSDEYDGGIYVGPAGLTYMVIHLLRHSGVLTVDERNIIAVMGRTALDNHLKYYDQKKDDKRTQAEFLTGKGGVNVVGAIFGKLIGDEQLSKKCLDEFMLAAKICKPLDFRKSGGDELFVGRTGYLCGALFLQQNLGGQPIPKQDLRDIWRAIIESGKAYAARKRSPCPLMYSYYNTEYLGAAHGVSSILQILLSFPEFGRENPADEQTILQAVNYYLTLQDASGNFPCSTDEVTPGNLNQNHELVHWCHGAPGAFYMFAKAYLHFQDEKYLNACIRCGDVIWERGLLTKGPGICHGVTGNAYVFLILHRLLGPQDTKNLYRAGQFAEFLRNEAFLQQARTPDCPYSLYEGHAGAACFLADLMYPDEAAFPFFDIYYNYQ